MNDAEIMALLFVAVAVAFYVVFMRPIQKEQAQHKQQMRDLRQGDRVLTTSNFIATIRQIEVMETGETQITLDLGNGLLVKAFPNAIYKRLDGERSEAPTTTGQATQ